MCLELTGIFLQRSGIGVQILVSAKLHGIDKNAGDHEVCELVRSINQTKVARMQVSHRWNKCDCLSGVSLCLDRFSKF